MQATNETTPKRKDALETSQRKMEADGLRSWKRDLRKAYKKQSEDF